MPDLPPPLPLSCTTREAGLIAIGELAVTRRLLTATIARVRVGGLLWVREPFYLPATAAALSPGQYVSMAARLNIPLRVHYAADEPGPPDLGVLRFARSMPRELSRLVLTVTALRREPLHAITDEQARASCYADRAAFAGSWDTTILKGIRPGDEDRWASNPEVAVIEFTAERRNIALVGQPRAEAA